MSNSIFIFIGPPGAGKGTLSKKCVEKLNWVQLSTGNLCRWHISQATDIGKKIDFAIKSGKLVSDSLITEMVCSWLEDIEFLSQPVILDGFPRTVAQARSFNEILKSAFPEARLEVVVLKSSDETVIERLQARYICKNKECQITYSMLASSSRRPKKANVCDECNGELGRRRDDEPEAIKERLRVYREFAGDLLNFYKEQDVMMREILADSQIDHVFESFRTLMGQG